MNNDQLEKLAHEIGSMTLGAKKECLTAVSLLHKRILKSLAEGKPASTEDLGPTGDSSALKVLK